MNINKLDICDFLLKLANNTGKKSIVRKMLIELLEGEVENDQEFPVRQLRNLLYANAKDIDISLVQEKTPQKYKAEDLQQELDKLIEGQQIGLDFFGKLGVRPVVRENPTEGNQPKEFWLEFMPYDLSGRTENQKGKFSKISVDDVQSQNLDTLLKDSILLLQPPDIISDFKNNLDIVYERSALNVSNLSRRARFFFNQEGELIVRSPKGITFMLALMIGYVFNWIVLLATIGLFVSALLSKNIWMTVLTFVYLVVLIPFLYSNYKNKYQRMNSLVSRRIIKAPAFLLSGNQFNADLELFRPTDFNIARVSEIISICPICASQIQLSYGDDIYKYYLVGRCRNAPDDHVFSFDRMKLTGFFLGHEGYLKGL